MEVEIQGKKYKLSDGVTMEELEGSAAAEAFARSQKAYQLGFVRFQPYGQVLPRVYARCERQMRELEIREDDVWISSFPKCGTTWTEEMVWCIMNDLDYERAKKETLDVRIPYVEFMGILSPDSDDFSTCPDTIGAAEKMEGRRILKTHLSVDMLPKGIMEKKAKIIYVARNPRDVCASFFNHWKIFEGYHGTFDVFADAFLDDVCGYYTPFLGHVLDYWRLQKEADNVLFIFYEDMKRDLAAVAARVAAFLGKPVAEADMPGLLAHLSFDKMKNNPAVNKQELVQESNKNFSNAAAANSFMRQGKSGNWRKHLSEEQVQRFQKWEERWLRGSDLKFQYD